MWYFLVEEDMACEGETWKSLCLTNTLLQAPMPKLPKAQACPRFLLESIPSTRLSSPISLCCHVCDVSAFHVRPSCSPEESLVLYPLLGLYSAHIQKMYTFQNEASNTAMCSVGLELLNKRRRRGLPQSTASHSMVWSQCWLQ